jgi:hypothetical protein
MRKGSILFTLILGVICLAAFTVVYAESKAPDKDLTINTPEIFKEKKQAPVTFNHAKHKDQVCTNCHHEYKDGQNVWKEGQEVKKCSACHKDKDEGKAVKLYSCYHKKEAEHSSCVGCHTKLKADNKKTGPTACPKCHIKEAK